jgi:YVTN family beta-propeller protein
VVAGESPDGSVVSSDGRQIWVTNYGGGTLSLIDGATLAEVLELPVGGHPHGIRISPGDHRVYVSLEDDDQVAVVDTATRAVIDRYPVGDDPHGLGMNPAGTRLVTGNLGSHDLTVLDAQTGATLQTLVIGAGAEPHVIEFDRSGTRAYVSNLFAGDVLVLDSSSGPCPNAADTLCLHDGRFALTVAWRTGDGGEGVGTAIPMTSESGLFWFFAAGNLELLVKVLDGCSLNDRWWVFSAATTNVEHTLTVTDTTTSAIRTYFNPQGAPAVAITDTSAFATCP